MKRTKWDNTYKSPGPNRYGRVEACLIKLEIGFKQILQGLLFYSFERERELGRCIRKDVLY